MSKKQMASEFSSFFVFVIRDSTSNIPHFAFAKHS